MARAGRKLPRARRGSTKTYENEIAFFSFLLLFGIGPFQWVTSDSSNFFSPLFPAARAPRGARFDEEI
jgi:hypothetical protein